MRGTERRRRRQRLGDGSARNGTEADQERPGSGPADDAGRADPAGRPAARTGPPGATTATDTAGPTDTDTVSAKDSADATPLDHAESDPRHGRWAGDDEVDQRRPSPHDLAERSGAFAMTASVQDPDDTDDPDDDRGSATEQPRPEGARGKPAAERGTRGQSVERDAERENERGTPGRGDSEADRDDSSAERGLRSLVGGGSSQVSIAAALRARDAARPTEADLAAAEADLVIVRRGWVPRESLPRTGRR